MRIAFIRAKYRCGDSYGVGFRMSHWSMTRSCHCAILIMLWWWHVVIEFRDPGDEAYEFVSLQREDER